MGTRDPRIDAYIAKAAPFAQPILNALREIVHGACPNVEETIKWSRPSFDYQGSLVMMSAFKAHMSFGFWMSAMMAEQGADREVLERLDRLESMKELPSKKAITTCIKQAMALNEAGMKLSRPKSSQAKSVDEPPELTAALAKKKSARAAFDAMSPSHRREYCEWIADAKREETKATRVAKTLELLSEGKSMNWKYDSRQVAKAATPASAPTKKKASARGTA